MAKRHLCYLPEWRLHVPKCANFVALPPLTSTSKWRYDGVVLRREGGQKRRRSSQPRTTPSEIPVVRLSSPSFYTQSRGHKEAMRLRPDVVRAIALTSLVWLLVFALILFNFVDQSGQQTVSPFLLQQISAPFYHRGLRLPCPKQHEKLPIS